ncbi:hypothetical protein S7711_11600, partial [Stachybotrys chartarum IBT 7711]
DKGY